MPNRARPTLNRARPTRLSRFSALLLAGAGLVACTSAGSPVPRTPQAPSAFPRVATPTPTAPRTTAPRTTVQRTTAQRTTAAPGSTSAREVFAAMSERQRIGQLLMVDCPSSGISTATRNAIERYHVGSVILDGTSTAGRTHVRAVTSAVQRLAPKHAALFVATDQEGGYVQRLQGSHFSRIPSGLAQGRLATGALRRDAEVWGRQLEAAGVNVDLGPVLDTVPAHFGSNPPIGDLDREYGHSPARVRSHGLAFAAGMADAGVDATAKHFPGLGRVRGNTDTESGVTDTVTTRDDAYLAPFRAAAESGVPFVMMSTAIYRHLDPGRPAAFSAPIVTGLLRKDLGFHGVIISDDLGGARAVSRYSVGGRAVAFVAAGGDMVLTVDASQARRMTSALARRAAASAGFRKKVDAAALLVLRTKAAGHLLR